MPGSSQRVWQNNALSRPRIPKIITATTALQTYPRSTIVCSTLWRPKLNVEAKGSHREDAGISKLSDQEIEARVFKELEAQQREWGEDLDGASIILQYPDNRTLFQRIAARLKLRRCSIGRKTQNEAEDSRSESE